MSSFFSKLSGFDTKYLENNKNDISCPEDYTLGENDSKTDDFNIFGEKHMSDSVFGESEKDNNDFLTDG